MSLITLVGASGAEPGREFYYLGPIEECRDCRLKGVCFNLEAGSRYRIVEVRDQRHECREQEGDMVAAVVVEKVPTPGAVPKKSSIEGSVVTFQPSGCGRIGCPNYMLCNPIGKADGAKCSVVAVNGDLECPIGRDMVSVDLM